MLAGEDPGIELVAAGVTKKYKRKVVVDAVSLSVRQGEIVGLAGMMGAGRTCLLRSLVGALTNAHVDGGFAGPSENEDTWRKPPTDPVAAIRQGLFLIPEDRKLEALFLEHDLAANVTAATVARRC